MLVRSRKPAATWTWLVEHEDGVDPLAVGAPVVVDLVRVLDREEVFRPEGIDVEWCQDGAGCLGSDSRLIGVSDLTTDALVDRVRGMHPDGYELAEPATLRIFGTGRWVAADGVQKEEPGLLDVSVDVADEDTMVELSVHHDIWMENSFSGEPHPEIHERNAPRLRHLLLAIEEALGAETDPDGSTALGTSFNYGVRSHRRPGGGPFDATPWV